LDGLDFEGVFGRLEAKSHNNYLPLNLVAIPPSSRKWRSDVSGFYTCATIIRFPLSRRSDVSE
jgi:hypothetical protein